MLGDKAREMIIEDMQKKPIFPRILFYPDFRELKPDTNPVFEREVITTRGDYSIQYLKDKEKTKHKTPFLISCDLFYKSAVYFESYKDLKKQMETAKNPRDRELFKILVEYTTLSQQMFKIAKEHPSLKLPFSLDVVKVYKEVKKNSKEGNRFILRPEMMQIAEEIRRETFVRERNWVVL